MASAPTNTLGDALPREIARVQNILVEYAKLGPSGEPGSILMRASLAAAIQALAEGDVAMLHAYDDLKGWQL